MDVDRLGRSPVGKLVPISGVDQRWGEFDYVAFVPDPLPQEVRLSETTVATVIDAAMALGRLDASTDKLPNPGLLVRPALSAEAVSTSALEGTFAPLTEVLEGEIVGQDHVSPSAREVLNYVRAANRGIELLDARPISRNLVSELQAILVEGTRGDAFDSGKLRERVVLIGSEQRPISEARFVPPPHEHLPDGVAAWEKWIHREGPTHLLVRVALGHYQFEALHPFSDGNGRLGRLIVALQLIEGNALRYPLLNISEWLQPRKEEYQDHLLETSMTGDHDAWVGFMCRGIKEQSENAMRRIENLLALRDSFVEIVRRVPGSRGGTAVRIAENLIGQPMFDVPLIAKVHGVSYQSANEAINRLVGLGLVRRFERRRGRPRKLFLTPAVMRELEG